MSQVSIKEKLKLITEVDNYRNYIASEMKKYPLIWRVYSEEQAGKRKKIVP